MCKVTNAKYTGIKILKNKAKRNRKKNKFLKNSKTSLDEIALNYGLNDWQELINYSVLPLNKKEKLVNNQEFLRLNYYIYELNDLILSIINSYNKKSIKLFIEVYKRFAQCENRYVSDLRLLEIVFYVFIHSSNKLDLKYLIKLFDTSYLLKKIEKDFKNDDFIKDSYHKELIEITIEECTSFSSFVDFTKHLEDIFCYLDLNKVMQKDYILLRLTDKDFFKMLCNNKYIIKSRSHYEFYTSFLKEKCKTTKKSIYEEHNLNISNYIKYY